MKDRITNVHGHDLGVFPKPIQTLKDSLRREATIAAFEGEINTREAINAKVQAEFQEEPLSVAQMVGTAVVGRVTAREGATSTVDTGMKQYIAERPEVARLFAKGMASTIEDEG